MTEAPRWRLTSAHYLNVPELPDGTKVEWEHKETTRESGRSIRKLYAVPILLNPNDAADCNYPGEIIVTQFTEGAHILSRDYIFIGEPTQEMEPLNEAAQTITDSLRNKWINPIDTLPVNGGMNAAESAFMARMMEAFAKSASPTIDNTAVPKADYDELKERLAKLEAMLASGASAKTAHDARRV